MQDVYKSPVVAKLRFDMDEDEEEEESSNSSCYPVEYSHRDGWLLGFHLRNCLQLHSFLYLWFCRATQRRKGLFLISLKILEMYLNFIKKIVLKKIVNKKICLLKLLFNIC